MNKDKTIKDLKERNHKLANQSRQHEIREIHYLYKCEQLEKRIKELEEENKKLKEELKDIKEEEKISQKY